MQQLLFNNYVCCNLANKRRSYISSMHECASACVCVYVIVCYAALILKNYICKPGCRQVTTKYVLLHLQFLIVNLFQMIVIVIRKWLLHIIHNIIIIKYFI